MPLKLDERLFGRKDNSPTIQQIVTSAKSQKNLEKLATRGLSLGMVTYILKGSITYGHAVSRKAPLLAKLAFIQKYPVMDILAAEAIVHYL